MAISQTISGIINSYYKVTAINTATNTVTLNSTSGLSNGTKILLIQMKGADIDVSNSTTFGNISAINDAGNYEFNYVCSINGNDVTLQFQILRSYDPADQVQLVSVPVYNSVTVASTVTSSAWDPSTGTGGVVVFEATNTVFLNANIDVSGQGFQGGALINYLMPAPYDCDFLHNITDYWMPLQTSPPADKYKCAGKKGEGIADYIVGKEYGRGKQSSGGGGGNSNNTGGAGGSNYGAGGGGGQRTNESSAFLCHGVNPGIGGLSLSPYGYTVGQNKIFMGGGGGSGHENNDRGEPGGNGGGIVIITASLITGTGNSILAKGISPTNALCVDIYSAEGDGGGGGGAGGTVILNVAAASGSIQVNVDGANGSNASNVVINDCTGPGGGGGAGVVWTAGGSIPAAIVPSYIGGSSGVVAVGKPVCTGSANFATAGTNGIAQTGYVAPAGTAPVCTILPIAALKYFKGKLTDVGTTLVWEMDEVNDVDHYEIESSLDQVLFAKIASLENSGLRKMSFDDQQKFNGTIYYRLKLLFNNGSIGYSAILTLSRNTDFPVSIVSLQPNPATDHTTLVIFAEKTDELNISIYNAYGQRINSATQNLNIGYSSVNIPLSSVAAGTYFLYIKGKYIQTTKRFIKTQ